MGSPKIAVVAEVYSPNLGDGLIYETIAYLLNNGGGEAVPVDLSLRTSWELNSRIHCSYNDRYKIRNFIRGWIDKNLRIRNKLTVFRWKKREETFFIDHASKAIAESDAVLIGGGQLLNDTYLKFPLRVHGIVQLALYYQKPLAFYGVGVGKYWSAQAADLYRSSLPYANYISVRDEKSAQRLKARISYSGAIRVDPDPVFALNTLPKYSQLSKAGPKTRLGLNVMSFSILKRFVPSFHKVHYDQYLEFWRKIVNSSLEAGLLPELFVNGGVDDWHQAELIKQFIESHGNNINLKYRPGNPAELVGVISSFDYVLATRMHAGITAFSLGKSVAAMVWDDKVTHVWESAGPNIAFNPEIVMSEDPWETLQEILFNQGSDEKECHSLSNKIKESFETCIHTILR